MFNLQGSWSDRFPTFAKPKIIGYFSLDNKRSYSEDATQLSYYYPVSKLNNKIHFDLHHGIENVQRKPRDRNEGIDHILRWIKSNSDKIRATPNNGKWIEADFVIYRGQLTKIMKSLYDVKEGWILRVVKFKGTLYLCSLDTEEQKIAEANLTVEHRNFQSWGFKFEKYLLTHDPKNPPDPLQPVNECEEFNCVFTTRLNNKKILFGGEVDGCYSDQKLAEPLPLDCLKFIELKTSKTVSNVHQRRTLEKYKFLRWWCQSFLVGIEDILCAFRNDNGIVESLKEYKVSEIGRNYRHHWSAGQCMNLLDDFLQFVKDNVVENYDRKIYVFERIPNKNIRLTTVSPKSKLAFLPAWFTES